MTLKILQQIQDYGLLALGFGFVIFFHELGHFLAAKYCDVRVEQFAVGFGPAIFSWRKGLGFRWGSTQAELEKKLNAHLESKLSTELKLKEETAAPTTQQFYRAADELGISDTEYRLNWIPLGGYVKMLGQDDLRPGEVADDPRAYNNKSIRARMLIVSAGVIMNIILAAIGFMVVFRLGYPVSPPIVGRILSGSPAASAQRVDGSHVALKPGDRILTYNGNDTSGDFGKIILDVALTEPGATVPIGVKHPDGSFETLRVTPSHRGGDPSGLLALGIEPPMVMRGLDAARADWNLEQLKKSLLPEVLAVAPGDTITQINGTDVQPDDVWKLSEALDKSGGKPVDLSIKSADGKISHAMAYPHFSEQFGDLPTSFLGMQPRTTAPTIIKDSPTLGKLKPGDIFIAVDVGSDHVAHPDVTRLRDTISKAGEKQQAISMTVLSVGDTKPHVIENITPNVKLKETKKMGLSIGLQPDEQHLVVSQVRKDTSAYLKITDGATITAINGKPVSNWFEVRDIIAAGKSGDALAIAFIPDGAESAAQTASVTLSAEDVDAARTTTIGSSLELETMPGTKQSNNVITDLKWGISETRDLILQFYLTLRRMTTGGVATRNLMGPVGMFATGAQLADRGANWLIWFLSMISANLAVVNFLPIPIVDGGLFTLLVLEKIAGKPLSQDTQKIIQMVGLALILGVFLLVTYQDIARIWG